MAVMETRVLEILGGKSVLRAERPKVAGARGKGRSQLARKPKAKAGEPVAALRLGADVRVDPGESSWTDIIRAGLPSVVLQNLAENLHVSLSELSRSLRLPERTLHRRLAQGQWLTSEETERNIRVARALAKAQQLLGEENGRGWLLEPCRGLGSEQPIKMLDTADGFSAVMDELGRLEYGVIS